jgi:hypothetical protein
MSREFIQAMFDDIDARNWESLRGRFCEDAVYERPGYDPLEGREAILHFYEKVRIIISGEHQLTRIVTNEECGASWGRFVGKSRQGDDLDERFADCYTFEDGKVKTRVSYFFRPAI